MSLVSVKIRAHADNAEKTADALLERGALSVELEHIEQTTLVRQEGSLGPQTEELLVDPSSFQAEGNLRLWQNVLVIALFDPEKFRGHQSLEDNLNECLSHVAEEYSGLDMPDIVEMSHVADQDWVKKSQSQFSPIYIDQTLCIRPSWHDSPLPDMPTLTIDPGMAFGTGSHETTQLCLAYLCSESVSGKTVLDYGCGSGILALSAAKLGAKKVCGIDIDLQAVEVASQNAKTNSLEDSCVFKATEEPVGGYFDIVVANILSSPLKMLAPLISQYLHLDSGLALSGILRSQSDEVIEAYAPYLDLRVTDERAEWVLLTGKRT